MEDAGASPSEIDAFYFGNAMSGMTENETHLAPKLASHIGLAGVPAQQFEDACNIVKCAQKRRPRDLSGNSRYRLSRWGRALYSENGIGHTSYD